MVKRKYEEPPIGHNVTCDWMNASTVIPVDKLVIAKAKVQACEHFLSMATSEPQKLHILLVHGPTCSGKTVLIRSICAHLQIDLVQVDDLIDMDYGGLEETRRTHIRDHQVGVMQTCMQNSKFPALSLFNNRGHAITKTHHDGVVRKVTFMDDIDGMSELSLNNLCKTLKRQTSGIFILTCADWFAVCKMCRALRDLPVTELQLNQLAVTFIQKAIRFWGFDPQEIPKEMIEAGDLRATLNHAYMKRLSREYGLSDQNCDQNLTLFHALGRLFYPLKNRLDLWTPFIPEDRQLFLLYIHHNMFPFMASLDEASAVLEGLSAGGELVECVLSWVVNRPGRVGNKVKPGFTRPEYLDYFKKAGLFHE